MATPSDRSKTAYALSLAWQLGFLIATPIGGFIFLGALLDRHFGTGNICAVLGAFIGLCVTVQESYRLLRPFLAEGALAPRPPHDA